MRALYFCPVVSFYFSSPNLSSRRLDVYNTSTHGVTLVRQSEKKLLKQQYLLHMSPQYGELRPLAAEIGLVVWVTPANFNEFRVLAALLNGTVVVGVSQTLRRSTEGATYIRQGGHHVGHWPTFLVPSFFFFMVALCNRADHYIFMQWFLLLLSSFLFPRLISVVGDWMSTILPHMVWP